MQIKELLKREGGASCMTCLKAKVKKKPQRHKVTGLHSAYSVFLCDLSVSVFQKTLTGINPVSLQAPLFFQIPVRIACSIVQVQRRLYCKQLQLV